MFKLLELQLQAHPFLGDINLKFTDEGELENGPYTTVIIGPNGTGKSEILRLIIDILRENDQHLRNKEKTNPVSCRYELLVNHDSKIFSFNNKGSFSSNQTDYNVADVSCFPVKIIATSILLNDKFPVVDSKDDDIYQYVGIRRSPQVAGTRDLIKKVVKNISIIASNSGFEKNVKYLLKLLGYTQQLWISYYPRRKHIFFKGDLTIEKFSDFYENPHKYTQRKTESWSVSFYKKIKDNEKELTELIDYINYISSNLTEVSVRSKAYFIDIFGKSRDIKKDIELIEKLERLDLVSYPGIDLEKEKSFDILNASSGEYHLLISFLGIMTKINPNSLLLLDEPDISLHLNWQMKYIHLLKDSFKEFSNCHFLIATHSHSFVSDLEPSSSRLIGLTRDDENKIMEIPLPKNTYGWSAEEILYKVFRVKTTRNYYLESDLRELLHKIAIKSDDKDGMNSILTKIKNLSFNEADPINLIIGKAEEYLRK